MESAADIPKPQPLRTIFVGDAASTEFRAAAESLAATTCCSRAADLRAALAAANDAEPPDLIVLAPSRSGEVRKADLAACRRRAPLARIVLLAGDWQEGELRSGAALEGAIRLAWHQWDAWWDRERRQYAAGRCPSWGLPLTATDDERLLFSLERWLPKLHGTVGLAAGHETAACWESMCRAMGLETVRVAIADGGRRRRRPKLDALVVDADGAGGDSCEAFLRVARAWRGTPVLAVLDFLRAADSDAWRAGGVAAVMSRPLGLDELAWQLERWLPSMLATDG